MQHVQLRNHIYVYIIKNTTHGMNYLHMMQYTWYTSWSYWKRLLLIRFTGCNLERVVSMRVLSCWPAVGFPRSYQCVQRIYMALRTYIWNVHEVKVHCPIRHPSRYITKILFYISKLSDFDKKIGIWHFCDAKLNFTVFDQNFLRSKHLPKHIYT